MEIVIIILGDLSFLLCILIGAKFLKVDLTSLVTEGLKVRYRVLIPLYVGIFLLKILIM